MPVPHRDRPRIPPVAAQTPEVTALLDRGLVDENGKPLTIFRTLAHHPALLARWNGFTEFFFTDGVLPVRIREIAALRTAWRTGCRYVWGQHVLIGREAGLSDQEIASLARPSDDWAGDADGEPSDLAAVVVFVDEMVDLNDVTDRTWHDTVDRYSVDQILELIVVVGLYRMAAGFLNTTGVQLDDDAPSWPGEGTWQSGRTRSAATFAGHGERSARSG
jgi:alkylhydroperoxidase family enzyme